MLWQDNPTTITSESSTEVITEFLGAFLTFPTLLGLLLIYVFVGLIKEGIYIYAPKLITNKKDYDKLNFALYPIVGLVVSLIIGYYFGTNLLGIILFMILPKYIWKVLNWAIDRKYGKTLMNKLKSRITKKFESDED